MAKRKWQNGGRRGNQDDDTVDPGDAPGGAKDVDRPDQDDDDEPDDMSKSLDSVVDRLEGAIRTVAPREARKRELFQKSASAGLTRKEEQELAGLLEDDGALRRSATAALDDNEPLQRSINGTPFLEALAGGVTEGLGVLSDRLEKSLGEGARFQVAVAESLIELAEGMRALHAENTELRKSLDSFGSKPAREPRSVPGVGASRREFAGNDAAGGGGGERLSKSMAEAGLMNALAKGVRKLGGRDIQIAASMIGGMRNFGLDPAVEKDLQPFIPKTN